MEHIGIDVHKSESQICIVTEQGELIERRIRTDRGRLAAVLGSRARAKVLLEAGTESEWVARCLEDLGHEVVVADPGYAPMYASRSRRVKTDRRDALALAQACEFGTYRAAHRTSEPQRRVRAQLGVRDQLVQSRTRQINLVRTLLRAEGLRVGSGSAERFEARLARLPLPEWLAAVIAPLRTILAHLTEQIALVDRTLQQRAREDERVERLRTVPGVGPLTALAFVAAVDEADRFRDAHQLEAYLGLVPRERSSGERQHRGPVTKAGNPRVRWLLIEAAWRVWRWDQPQSQALRSWVTRVAMRRGRSIAAVALARKLAGILYALLRDGSVYEPARARRAPDTPVAISA